MVIICTVSFNTHKEGLLENQCNLSKKAYLHQFYCFGGRDYLLFYYVCSTYKNCDDRISCRGLYHLWIHNYWSCIFYNRVIQEIGKEYVTNYFFNFITLISNLFCSNFYFIDNWCYSFCSLDNHLVN